jgi:hypothetical protein
VDKCVDFRYMVQAIVFPIGLNRQRWLEWIGGKHSVKTVRHGKE